MATRFIYIPDELNIKLRTEENASGLISRLLYKYYGENLTDSEEVIKLKKRLEVKKDQQAAKINEEIRKCDKIIKQQQKAEVEKEQNETQEYQNVVETLRKSKGREPTQDEIQEGIAFKKRIKARQKKA